MINVKLHNTYDVSISEERFPNPRPALGAAGCDPFTITYFEFHMEDGGRFTVEVYNDGLDKFAVNDDRS